MAERCMRSAARPWSAATRGLLVLQGAVLVHLKSAGDLAAADLQGSLGSSNLRPACLAGCCPGASEERRRPGSC